MKKNRKVSVLTDKEEIKKAEEFLNDGYQDKWEKGELGKSLEHSIGEKANISGAPTTIRLPDSLKITIATLAREKGLTTNSYIRMILTEHVKQKKRA
ncbi:hypothetical protein QEJ31_02740 [Pigmentibacter sp. JX0631]|uniref:hypothetical protein n=1 Tax=Pigmentibacter sp. JX0631 TaxID=2976982 RepID=UPI0024690EEC|nr:hypothetical protein [Pigmentibacter sp. JX0631]WGL60517.1 hypothetical protein QEJ31_02740 [Pigmentibacter sp. JX0631]